MLQVRIANQPTILLTLSWPALHFSRYPLATCHGEQRALNGVGGLDFVITMSGHAYWHQCKPAGDAGWYS